MKTSKPQSVEDHPLVIAKRAEIATVAERMKLAERREQVARQRLRDLRPAVIGTADVAKKKASAANAVKKLLAGGTVSSADPASELAAAEREQAILHEAQIQLATELRQIISELSDQLATNYLAPRIRDGSIEVYEHLARAASALAQMRATTTDALQLGYSVSSSHCPDVIAPSAWRLGDPSDTGSELARMRNALVTKGWMK
jgi:hypothetical protein